MRSRALTLRLTMAQLILVTSVAHAADWPMLGRDATRNAVSLEPNPPTHWNAELLPSRWEKGKVVEGVAGSSNVKWVAELGWLTRGDPVISGGLVWVGTSNARLDGTKTVDASVLACFRESDGRPLYRYVSPRLPVRVHDWPYAGMAGSPLIEGDRLYLVSNRAEVICFDIGPLLRSKENETRTPDDDPHVLWKLDMVAELGIFPRGQNMGIARFCSPASWGEFLYVITPNGVDEAGLKVPAPDAPALICLEKSTGRVMWSDASPGDRILEYQWASPLVLEIDGTPQCVAPLGDGWVRSFHARTGELLWEFDMNAKAALFRIGGLGQRNYLLAPPVFAAGKIYIASGWNPEWGDGYGRLVCLDPTKRGDISSELAVDAAGKALPRRRERAIDPAKSERAVPNPNSGLVWEFTGKNEQGRHRFGRTIASVAVANGLVIAPDFDGFIYCFDAATGEHYWTHDAFAGVYAGPLIAGGKAYVADEDGEVTVLKLSKQLHVLAENVHTSSAFCTVFANGTLYVAGESRLYAIAGEAEPKADPAAPPRIERDTERAETRRVPRAMFAPTPDDVVLEMLELAGVGSDDIVYDLGSGDGRIVNAAAKTYGCRATGVEISPDLVRLSRERAREAGVEHLTQFERGDLFDTDFSGATVVTLYLLQTQNEALLPKLRDLKPGARVVAHHFSVPGLKPDRTVKVRSTETNEEHALYLYTAPFAVAGQVRGYWPQWRGPVRENVSADSGLLQEWPPGGPPLLYQIEGLGEGIATVSIAGGRLFTISRTEDKEDIVALNEADGSFLWASYLGKTAPQTPLMQWLTQRSPTLDGNRLYAVSGLGDLACLQASDGRELWRLNYERDLEGRRGPFGFGDRPLVDGNRLLVLPGASTGSVMALDKITGKVLWKCAVPEESWSTYGSGVVGELHDVRQYIVSLNSGEIGVDVADGRLLWTRLKPGRRLHGTHTPCVRDQQVLLHLGYGRQLVLLDLVPSNGLFEPREIHASPAIIDPFQDNTFLIGDHSYVLSNIAGCYEWKTGSVVWQERMGTSRAAATYADGRAFVRDAQGRVMLLKVTPKGKLEHGAFTLPHVGPASGATSPVVAGGRLYLRDQGTLYVYDVRRRDRKQTTPETRHIVLPPPAIAGPPDVGGGPADHVPDAAFVPTPDDVVERMLKLADVKKEDVVYDLGSGDGRIVIAAAKAYGCRAVGIEIDPGLVKFSREKALAVGVRRRVTIEQGNLFERDLSDADVVTLYLHPPVLERLKPRLATLKPGRRIVSHAFRIPGVEPRQSISMPSTEDGTNHEIHLYVTPLEPVAD